MYVYVYIYIYIDIELAQLDRECRRGLLPQLELQSVDLVVGERTVH